jgi:hypothetical protein
MTRYAKRNMKYSVNQNFNLLTYVEWDRFVTEIATCKQNVGQKENFMHSNFQMVISLPWIDAAFT